MLLIQRQRVVRHFIPLTVGIHQLWNDTVVASSKITDTIVVHYSNNQYLRKMNNAPKMMTTMTMVTWHTIWGAPAVVDLL
jgi:hypothetical protein